MYIKTTVNTVNNTNKLAFQLHLLTGVLLWSWILYADYVIFTIFVVLNIIYSTGIITEILVYIYQKF